MQIPVYHIDAFTDKVFSGNPAAVCPLDQWLPGNVMQGIAAENNLSETAFFMPKGGQYELRWFSPKTEIDLCGHATLASAFVVFNYLDSALDIVRFFSPRSGALTVSREQDLLTMDFPSQPAEACEAPADLAAGLGAEPLETLRASDYLAVFASEEEIAALRPDMQRLARLDKRGVVVTARGNEVDFVSRFFAPRVGVDEDPVTGSSHCTLVPYWKSKLGKNTFHARQISARGGELFCEDCGDRVRISGRAVSYMQGKIDMGDTVSRSWPSQESSRMDNTAARGLLQTMIDYFESGNKETDRAAKAILEWDDEHLKDWQAEIKRLRDEGEWTGIRAPEADIVAGALRSIQQQLVRKQ